MAGDRKDAWWQDGHRPHTGGVDYEAPTPPSMPKLDPPDPTSAQIEAKALKRRIARERAAYDRGR